MPLQLRHLRRAADALEPNAEPRRANDGRPVPGNTALGLVVVTGQPVAEAE